MVRLPKEIQDAQVSVAKTVQVLAASFLLCQYHVDRELEDLVIMQLSVIRLMPHIYHAEEETLVKGDFAVNHLPWRKRSRQQLKSSHSSSATTTFRELCGI